LEYKIQRQTKQIKALIIEFMAKPKSRNKKFEFSHRQVVEDRLFTQEQTMEQIVEGIFNRLLNERLFDPYLSFKQVAMEFGFSRTWIYRQHANGHLGIYKFAGKVRIKRSEILKLGIPI